MMDRSRNRIRSSRSVDVNDNDVFRSRRRSLSLSPQRLASNRGHSHNEILRGVTYHQRRNHNHTIIDINNSSDTSSDDGLTFRLLNVHNPFGKYVSFCRGNLVLGPGRGCLCFSAISIVGILVLLVCMHDSLTREVGIWVPWLGYILWIVFLSLSVKISTTDPGIIPKDVSELDHRNYYPQLSYRDYGCRGMACRRCGNVRPTRAYHCQLCDVCISYQDIHLPCCGICIGERNRRFYFYLNANIVLLSLYLFINGVILISKAKKENETIFSIISLTIGGIMMFIPNLGIFMFLFRFYLIAVNRTFREEQQIINGFPISRSRYQGSCCDRLKEFLCPSFTISSYFPHRKYNRISPLTGNTNKQLGNSRRLRSWFGNGTNWNATSIQDDELNNDERRRLQSQGESLRLSTDKMDDSLSNANSAKTKSHHSDPILSDGELRNLPMTRPRRFLHAKPLDMIASNISNYQEMMNLPKGTINIQFQQMTKSPGTLSLGDLPTSTNQNQIAENELIYTARAQQMLSVAEFVANRDMQGLIEYWSRVDIGTLMGLGRMDPETLQIVELENGNPSLVIIGRRGGYRADIAQRRLTGITQMIAAGLMTRRDGLRIRDIFYTPPATIAQALQRQQTIAFRIPRPRQSDHRHAIIQQIQQRRRRRRHSQEQALLARVGTSSSTAANANNTPSIHNSTPSNTENQDNDE